MKTILLSLLIVTFAFTTYAQQLTKPTLEPVEPTNEQYKLIGEGTKLHDQKQFDKAIELYQKVLDESPNCALAMYEMGLSYLKKKEYAKSLEISLKASKYKTRFLPSTYKIIADALAETSSLEKSTEFYLEAIKLQPNSAFLKYRLGINYLIAKNIKEAKKKFKESVEIDYSLTIPHFFLADVFYREGYKIPSLLAASLVIATEDGTLRAKRANEIFQKTFNSGATKNEEKGSINIFLNTESPKDEGDFSSTELFISLGSAIRISKDDSENTKTIEQKFVDSINQFITIISDDKKNQDTFVGRHYFPFYKEMKRKGYTEAFAYLILQKSGNLDADKWILNNSQKTIDFIDWSKKFKPTK